MRLKDEDFLIFKFKKFEKLKIITCSPRGVENKNWFTSFSLSEFEEFRITGKLKPNGFYLIDIANGHMSKLTEVVKKVKKVKN
jgi:hypothetical protein